MQLKFFHQPSLEEIQQILKVPEYEWVQSNIAIGAEFAWMDNPTRRVYRYGESLLVKNENSFESSDDYDCWAEIAEWGFLASGQQIDVVEEYQKLARRIIG